MPYSSQASLVDINKIGSMIKKVYEAKDDVDSNKVQINEILQNFKKYQ